MEQPVQYNRFIAVTFSPEVMISSLSTGAEQWIGYSAQELIGRPITHILSDRTVFELPQMLETAGEWGIWQGEIDFMSRNGKQLCTCGSVSTLTGITHSNPGLLLLSSVDHLPSASSGENRLALHEVGARLRTLSHEMNNPLAVMLGFMQLIMLNPQCVGKMRVDMEKLFSEMNRVVRSVERLHHYALSLQEEPQSDIVSSIAG